MTSSIIDLGALLLHDTSAAQSNERVILSQYEKQRTFSWLSLRYPYYPSYMQRYPSIPTETAKKDRQRADRNPSDDGRAVMPVFNRFRRMGPRGTHHGEIPHVLWRFFLLCAILVRKERLFHGSHHVKSVFVCSLLFALDLTFWHRSIHFIGPGLSTLISNFQVFFLALFGVIILKEKSGWKLFVSIRQRSGLYLIVAPNWKSSDRDTGPGWGLRS
jgi:hypothetical protein